MNIKTQIDILAPKEKVWQVITDIENAANTISGIEKLEILEKPDDGLLGLKWKETRIMFGKEATEVMWITDVAENESYQVRAESNGMIYKSHFKLTEEGGVTSLEMEFGGKPQSFWAKLMSPLFGIIFKNASKKALEKDMEDIKAAVENN